MTGARVLVADDDVDIRDLVRVLLERDGHEVRGAADGAEALRLLYAERPDVLLLDVDMPGLDGWTVLGRVRELSDVPVLMLTAKSSELDKVRGLRAGADDYVVKPFGRAELSARVAALVRRGARTGGATGPPDLPDVYADALLTVDHRQRTALAGTTDLHLTPREFGLLAAFVRHPGQVLSGVQLVELVWGDPWTAPDQVKVAVGRLRRKLAAAAAGDPIETVRGFGYRYRPADGPSGRGDQ
jgi:DNA-binding response OmpR family regulator